MLSASQDQSQWDMFSPILKSFIDPKHPLVQLAETVDRNQLEEEFAEQYSDTGRPAHPIRLMVSLLLLKQMYGHGDETLPGGWVQNPYYQYFSGMDTFQWRFPVAPSGLSHVRARLGSDGLEFIFGWSMALHGNRAHEQALCVDTTAGGNQHPLSDRRQALREGDGAAARDGPGRRHQTQTVLPVCRQKAASGEL